MTELLECLWQNGIYGYYWTAPQKLSYWMPQEEIGPPPNGHQNVYFGINPVDEIPTTNMSGQPCTKEHLRSRNATVSVVNALFGEFDCKDWGDLDSIRNHLKQFPFPSITVHSGGGVHLYWLLNTTFYINSDGCRERIRRAQTNWVDFTGSDKQSKDLARVLRVPGTKNYKKCYSPNFPTVKVLKSDYNLTYCLEELEQLSKPILYELPKIPLPPVPRWPDDDDRKYYGQQAISAACQMIKDSVDGEKHSAVLKAAKLLGGYVAGGIIDEGEAIRILEAEIQHKSNVKNREAAFKTIRGGIEYGKAEPITLETKLQEREAWKQQQVSQAEAGVDKQYWARQYKGYWEKVR